ncbi:hypothetical protein H920_20088 [Fukomys damarensis]|uniref:Uncharacterized protein n=1 Tax=Fukomys damarensis TaxID=885580 RepID=A0A091CJ31_FUKDA|nr:hypothetical protein H920_20088 [Fukomys damarensis]
MSKGGQDQGGLFGGGQCPTSSAAAIPSVFSQNSGLLSLDEEERRVAGLGQPVYVSPGLSAAAPLPSPTDLGKYSRQKLLSSIGSKPEKP